MTEQEWLTSEDPAQMLRQLTANGQLPSQISDRKLRLFACALTWRY